MLARVHTTDVLVALAVGTLMQLEVVHERLTPYWASVPVYLLTAAALPLRRRAPLVPYAVGVLGGLLTVAAGVSLHKPFSPMIAAFVVLYSVGVYEPRRRALAALVAAVASAYAQIEIARSHGESYGVTDFGFVALLMAAPVLVGMAIRSRSDEAREARARAERAEAERLAAVAGERARIARELHDVIAHSVSVMVVQAGAAEEVLKLDPLRALAPVRAVQETGRQALVEMTRLVGLLRDDGYELGLEPQPGLEALDGLLAQMRDAGLPVELRVEGEPRPLPPAVELSAYRVVQEALTNALKHAGRACAEVRLRYASAELEIEVVDDGPGGGGGHSGGHGLAGMRERVAVFGGDFAAGPRPEGGFAVRARLPVEAPA